MSISLCITCLFAVLINKVSLQVTVEAVIGGSVVLPCSSTEHGLKPQELNVHWRDYNSKIVYDIVKAEDSVEDQDQRYKNRAETFPNEYERRNFSIKLINLQHTDAGEYTCFITPSDEQKTVQLIVDESTAGTGKGSVNQGHQNETGAALETSSHLLWVYFVIPVALVLIIGFILFLFRKRFQSVLLPFEEQRTGTEMTSQV